MTRPVAHFWQARLKQRSGYSSATARFSRVNKVDICKGSVFSVIVEMAAQTHVGAAEPAPRRDPVSPNMCDAWGGRSIRATTASAEATRQQCLPETGDERRSPPLGLGPWLPTWRGDVSRLERANIVHLVLCISQTPRTNASHAGGQG